LPADDVPVIAAKAVVFDLDGVLADSTHAVDKSWEVWSKRHGVDPHKSIEIGHGRTTIESIRIIAPHLDERAAFREMEELEASFMDTVVPVNGAPQTVRYLIERDIPWAVATSTSRNLAVPRLQRAQIPPPHVLITADDVTSGKPDPQPYQKAAEALGAVPWECVVFEDAAAGILAARRAGARVFAIDAGAHATLADASASDFADVEVDVEDGRVTLMPSPSRYRCVCCGSHSLIAPAQAEPCTLCRWPINGEPSYTIDEARENTKRYGVIYRPHDPRFAVIRHPILGARGEYAVDRTLLRERAFAEFALFAKHQNVRAKPPERLLALLSCIEQADKLYRKR
jgi:sugar-phosphatase